MAARAVAAASSLERLIKVSERRREMRLRAIEAALAKLYGLLGDPEAAAEAYLELHPLADPREVREAVKRLARTG